MHTFKGGWVGQSFALAKCNDSGGKKSRIRHSKEERKALVESFIKKYQKLNNGSFPSLKLTREQVGGSFYTIRESVRDVIQENRVLGPATCTPEEQKHDDILEQYPFGSVSIEPDTKLFSSNSSYPVTHILPHHLDASEELYISGSTEVFHKNEEHGTQISVVSEDREILVRDERVEDNEVSSAKGNCLEADLIVETSSLASGSMITYEMDDKLSVVNGSCREKGGVSSVEVKSYDLADEKLVGKIEVPLEESSGNYMFKEDNTNRSEELVLNATTQGLEPEDESFDEGLEINGSSKAFEINEDKVSHIAEDMVEVYNEFSDTVLLNENLEEKVTGSVGDEANFQGSASDLIDARMIANLAVQQLEKCRDSVVEKTEGKVEVPLAEISEVFSVKESTSDSIDSKVIGIKIADPVNGSNTRSSKGSKIRFSGHTIPKTAIATESNSNTNPTLHRKNLESWKTLDKSHKPSNPLLLFFKAFVTEFVKFWSE